MLLTCPNCGFEFETSQDAAMESSIQVEGVASPVSIMEQVPSDGAFQVGDRVMVLPPFGVNFPGAWAVDSINPETGSYRIAGDRDFSSDYLQAVKS